VCSSDLSYLTLFEDLYDDPENGHLAICSPPLRSRRERDELWRGIENGIVTLIGSDDCAFTRQEKEMGLERDSAGRISLNQLVGLCSANVARACGCWPRKGTLMPGSDADIAIFDPDADWIVSAANQHNGCGYSLHEGYKARGKVKTTLLRGQVIMENDTFKGARGQGRFIKRKIQD
jgi:dihydropyrimidinase